MRHLSRYLLSAADRRALRWTDSYSLHRIVYDLFEDIRGDDRQRGSGILFVDKGVRQGVSQVIILSDRLPRTPQRGVLETLQVTDVQVDRFSKGTGMATIARATLTGSLRVRERESFIRAACQGIGRARAFGCGLLQIVPCL